MNSAVYLVWFKSLAYRQKNIPGEQTKCGNNEIPNLGEFVIEEGILSGEILSGEIMSGGIMSRRILSVSLWHRVASETSHKS